MRRQRYLRFLQILLLLLAMNGFYLLEYRLVPHLGDKVAVVSEFALSMLFPPLRVQPSITPQYSAEIAIGSLQPLSVIGFKSLLYAIQGNPSEFFDPKTVYQPENTDSINKDTGGSEWDYQSPIASSIFMDEEGGNEEIGSDEDHTGPFALNNDTGLPLDFESLASQSIRFNTGDPGPKVLILHTHTTEAYTGGMPQNAPKNNTDNQRNVVRVGEEIARCLEQIHGIDTLHIKTVHDLPDYNYAYTNAAKTIQAALKQYPSIQVVLDVHRDGVANGQPYRTVLQLGDMNIARVMVVAGSPASGLPHPLWKENVKFGLHFAHALSQRVPGLVRSLYVSGYRYNQHMSTGALILEVGGDGNSIGESIAASGYIAAALADALK